MNPLRTMMIKALGAMFVKAATGTSYALTDAALGKFFATTSSSGKEVTDVSMMQVSAAWSCMRILAETIGSLPWKVYEDDGKGNSVQVSDHPVSDVLVWSPNTNMTSIELREAMTLNLCQSGNSYSFKETRANGDLVSLIPIESSKVEPKQRDDGTVYYRILERGRWEDYPQEKIWHIKGFGRSGLIGLSPIGAAREALGMALATEEFGSRFFSQGGMPSGIVTVDKFLNKDQREIARENLQQMLGGMGNAHKFALFEGGMKAEPWANMPLEDMQFILSRKFSIQEICRFFRIPPHMVADLDRATFSNIEHMSQEFVMFTLMPYFTRFEASATKWLFKPGDRRKYFLRFNYEGLLRADSTARAAFYNQLLQNGVMNRNEVRGKENLPRSTEKNMDAFTVQLSMTPIEKLGQEPAPARPIAEKQVIDITPQKSDVNTFNLVMPETMKQQLTQRVEVPGVDKLAASVKETAERGSLSNAALIGTVMKLAERMEESTAELKELVTADREVMFDAKGDPIGTRLVKRAY